ncbi:MAG: DUF5320 domain-containing protein [Syntrophomonadaceae bacterium]|nr:DUF5320 domain-containing protein [Syntrophomonadaceae bacterium]
MKMPRGDRTGPLGLGPLSGMGLGLCSRTNIVRGAAGLGLGLLLARRRLGYRALRRGIGLGVGLCPGLGLGQGFRRFLKRGPFL